MNLARRSRGIGLVAAACAFGFLFASSAAQATSPTWSPGGHYPACDLAIPANGGSGIEYTYADTSSPKIIKVTPRVVKVGNGPAVGQTIATFRVSDSCSGVATVLVAGAHNGTVGPAVIDSLSPADGNYFDHTTTWVGTPNITNVGKYTFPLVEVADRFSQFTLNSSSTAIVGSPTGRVVSAPLYTGLTASDQYRNTASYIVRTTTLSVAKNKSTLKKGASLTISGTLKVANGTTYVTLSGQKVLLQRRYVGSSKWVTLKSGTTNGSGKVSISTKPSSSIYYRLVYQGKLASPWNAPQTTTSTSKVTVKK